MEAKIMAEMEQDFNGELRTDRGKFEGIYGMHEIDEITRQLDQL